MVPLREINFFFYAQFFLLNCSTPKLSNSTTMSNNIYMIDYHIELSNKEANQLQVAITSEMEQPTPGNELEVAETGSCDLVEAKKVYNQTKGKKMWKSAIKLAEAKNLDCPELTNSKLDNLGDRKKMIAYLRKLADLLEGEDETEKENQRGEKRKEREEEAEDGEGEKILSHQTRGKNLRIEIGKPTGNRMVTRTVGLEEAIKENENLVRNYFLDLERTKPRSFKPTFAKHSEILGKLLN